MMRLNQLSCWTGLLVCGFLQLVAHAEPWKRHVIDQSSRGADGVRMADVNGDGHADLVTGWEEGGVVRAYLNPGPVHVRRAWPAVTVGQVKSSEDAVFVDLDGDGNHDVVSCSEGKVRSVFVHWAPRGKENYLDPARWQTTVIPVTQGKQLWMYAVPMQIDGQHGVDLVVGSKGGGASVGWLRAPRDPRQVSQWTFHPWYQAGWIMSLVPIDVDRDGDLDVVVSDRKGNRKGVLWLENPGATATLAGKAWKEHRVGGAGQEVMFLDVADLDQDGWLDIVSATRNKQVLFLQRRAGLPPRWHSHAIENPHGVPHGKAVAVADINGDGQLDLVHDTNTQGDRTFPGLVWMSYRKKSTDPRWIPHDISGKRGVKFDLIQVLDLDADGDLDVLSCEERDNLGVFWYENPAK